MSEFRQDLTYALRTFAKAPGFTATAVLVLAVGIGANTAILTVVNEMLFRPLSGRAGAPLVSVYSHDRTTPDSYRLFSYPNYTDLRDRRDVFDDLLAYTLTIVAGEEGEMKPRAMAAVVSSNYFDLLGATPAAGRSFSIDEERPGGGDVAIAPYALWKRAGLDPAFLGRAISINGRPYTIVGVAPEGFSGTMALLSPDIYLPLSAFSAVVNDRFKNNGQGLSDRSNAGLALAGILAKGLDTESVGPRLESVSKQLEEVYPGDNRNQVLSVGPMSRLSAGPEPRTDSALGVVSGLLLSLSGIVLVIACLNMANMLLARGSLRRRELALRLALGAGRGRLVRQLLTESLLLAGAGGALGLLAGNWATRALTTSLSSVLPFSMNFAATPNAAVVIATVGVACVATVAFGLGPALRLTRRDLVADLRDRANSASRGGRLRARNVLVVSQMALSMLLLAAGGILTRTAVDAARANPGFAYDGLIVASLDTTLAGLDTPHAQTTYADLLTHVRAMPGVAAASLASTVPFGESQESRRFEVVGDGGVAPATARAFRIIGADYFRTLGLAMVRGREFDAVEERSVDTPGVAVVDALFARQLFGESDPIGRTIRVAAESGSPTAAGDPLEIVGIAPPLREELLDSGPVSHVYVPFGIAFRAGMQVHVKLEPGVAAPPALDALRAEIGKVDARLPILSLATMAGLQARGFDLWGLRAGASVFAGLAALALVLAAIGIYGLRAYLVAQRTREFGIRMALGATATDVMRLVLGDGLRLTMWGLAFGLPLAALVSVALRSVFVDVGGLDLGVLGSAAFALAAAATIAGALPARRAGRTEPLSALRTE